MVSFKASKKILSYCLKASIWIHFFHTVIIHLSTLQVVRRQQLLGLSVACLSPRKLAVPYQGSLCTICGRWSGTGTGFSPCPSVFPCQYHLCLVFAYVSPGGQTVGPPVAAVPQTVSLHRNHKKSSWHEITSVRKYWLGKRLRRTRWPKCTSLLLLGFEPWPSSL